MTEKEIKKWLLRGREAKKYIEILQECATEAFDEATRATRKPQDIKVQTSKVNVSENKNIDYADSKAAVEAEIERLHEVQREINEAIKTLKNDRQRTVLTCYYILCKTWEEIADRLEIDLRSVYRIRDRAVTELAATQYFKIA